MVGAGHCGGIYPGGPCPGGPCPGRAGTGAFTANIADHPSITGRLDTLCNIERVTLTAESAIMSAPATHVMRAPDLQCHRRTFAAMGNTATITVIADSEHTAASALVAGVDRVHELEARWSRFLVDSEVSRYNQLGDVAELSGDTRRLLAHCEASRHRTGGLFDARVVTTMLQLGYDRSLVDARIGTNAAHAGAIDAGAIGKGLAADFACDTMRRAGALGALVNLGGDVRCFGTGDRDGNWVVDIASPDDYSEPLARIRLAEGGIATSSLRAKRWSGLPASSSHIIDPRSMTSVDPTTHHVVQATVIASTAAWAETFATAVLVESAPAAVALIDRSDLAALLVTGDGRLVRTSRWIDFR